VNGRNLLNKRKDRKERRMHYLRNQVQNLNSEMSEIDAKIENNHDEDIDI